jgi:hypothetical protein
MTPKIVREGMKFKLCGLVWEVVAVYESNINSFRAVQCGTSINEVILTGVAAEVMGCDWIEPEVKKLTKEQAEMIKDKLDTIVEFIPGGYVRMNAAELARMIDSITE